jgi:hypothetical protein
LRKSLEEIFMSEKLFTTRVSHTHQPTKRRRSRVLATVLAFLAAGTLLSISAAAQTITFESPTYTIGNINGQDGWTKTGSYDHTVSSSLGTAGFGAQSFRVSNAITSGGFADQSYSRSLANEAGETTAANNGLSGGIRQKNFEMEFNIASTVPGSQQPGLVFSISPDRGDGARMSYLRFEDRADGIHVIFDDYRDYAPFGTAIGDAANGCGAGGDNFTDIDIATLNRTTTHTIKFAIFFVDGPRNDVVQIYIDGVLKQTGTTWEDYSRYCQASQPATVDSLLFRTAGAAAPGTAGNGLLFDNMNSSSSTNVTPNLVVDDDGLGSAADCNDTSPAYSSISSAVVAANPGDTVRVCSGTYPLASTVALNKAGITVLGVGATKPVIQAASAIGNAFFVNASNVTIDNLEIQKTDLANQELIAVQGNNFTGQNNLIYGPNPGAIWNVAGFVSRAFVISNQTGTLITNNVIHTLRQPAYMSGSNNVAAGTISNNQVSGTKGWVVEGGNYTFAGNTWGEPQNQSCDIALLNDVSLNPAFYQPLLALSTANDNAFICAQYPAGENGRATAYVNDGAGPGGNGSDNANYTLINDAIAGALIGGTVQVAAGTYNEDVTVSKSVKILGAGPVGTTVIGPIGGGVSTFTIAANNVELSGFTITRAGNNTTDWNNAGLNTAGVSVQGAAITGFLMHDNLVTGMRTGIDINNSNGHTIRNNVIDNNRTGMIFGNQTDNMTVAENTITNNWTVGILFLDRSGSGVPPQSALNGTFFNNNISGNWYGQIVDRQSGGSLPAPGTTNLKNFSGNWYGTAAPGVTTANSAEPGYAAQIPVAFGGSAVPPGGQPDIAGPASANFDYTPLLAGGGDTNVQTTPGRGTYGFQGNFSALNVSAASAQTGAASKIQEAIDLITAGGTLSIPAGTYPGSVNVNKALSINGTFTVGGTFTTSAAGVVVSPGYSPGIINTGNLSFGSGTTVNMELNGVIAGTNYDQFNVTGTVNISPSVTLNATVGYAPGAGDSYTIINNDGGDAVTGIFAGLPDGTVFFIGANSFRIDYDGGDGNDVVITSVSLCNTVSIPTNITSLNGQVVSVPVNVDTTTGNGLYSADFTVTYNSSVLSPNGILATNFGVTLGTVGTSNGGGRTLTVNNPSPGTLVISIFGSNPFSGSGNIVNMSFNAIGLPGTTSPMNFSAFKFNEGTPCLTTSNGLVTILSGTITGTITYGNAIGAPAVRGIPNAALNAVGSVNTSANTDSAGFYTLSGMGSGPYTVTPSKTGGVNSALSGLDSARVAQHVVGLITLNSTQLTVADVSGAGGVSSFDSALIARYTVSLPNSGSSGTWVFTPVNRSYPNVNTNQTGQDYIALLMGDVTGNWNDPTSIIGSRANTTRGPKGISIAAGNASGASGSEIVVPVTIGDVSGKGVLAYQFEMNYDAAVLAPAANPVEVGGTMSDTMSVTANADTPGVLRVVVFGALPMNGQGTLLNLKFTAIGAAGTTSPLSWQIFMLNEGGALRTRTTDGQITVRTANSDEASISGSLFTAFGKGVANTRVTLTDTTGAGRTVLSNEFGSYQFGNVRVGETYTITAASRAFTFTPVTVSVSGNLANVDIIAEQ